MHKSVIKDCCFANLNLLLFAVRVAVDVDVVVAYKHYVNVLQSSLGLQKHRKQPEKLPGKVSVFCLFIGIFYP